MEKLVFGFGINDADYVTQKEVRIDGKRKVVWRCPYYRRWTNMLKRCYSVVNRSESKTYIDCTVCEEWSSFMAFRAWMLKQEWDGLALDKDLLVQGNSQYSPNICVFVSLQLNTLLCDSSAIRGEYALGVSWHSQASCFRSYVKDGGRQKHLGLFNNELEAHQAWQKAKRTLILNEVGKHSNSRIDAALMLRVNQLQHDLDNHQITRRL